MTGWAGRALASPPLRHAGRRAAAAVHLLIQEPWVPGESGEENHACDEVARKFVIPAAGFRRRRSECLPGAFRMRLGHVFDGGEIGRRMIG